MRYISPAQGLTSFRPRCEELAALISGNLDSRCCKISKSASSIACDTHRNSFDLLNENMRDWGPSSRAVQLFDRLRRSPLSLLPFTRLHPSHQQLHHGIVLTCRTVQPHLLVLHSCPISHRWTATLPTTLRLVPRQQAMESVGARSSYSKRYTLNSRTSRQTSKAVRSIDFRSFEREIARARHAVGRRRRHSQEELEKSLERWKQWVCGT